jgi:adenylate kinase family enzyme
MIAFGKYMIKPKLFIVTGISGSGKTTIARRLIQEGEVAFDSKLNPNLYQFINKNGEIATSVHLHDEAWRKEYKWSLNEERLNELLDLHTGVLRVFLCGRANLFQYWNRADKIFLLKVDKDTLRKRLSSESRDNLFAKDKVTQDKLLNDLDSIQSKILEKGAKTIDATAPVDNVVSQILQEAELR